MFHFSISIKSIKAWYLNTSSTEHVSHKWTRLWWLSIKEFEGYCCESDMTLFNYECSLEITSTGGVCTDSHVQIFSYMSEIILQFTFFGRTSIIKTWMPTHVYYILDIWQTTQVKHNSFNCRKIFDVNYVTYLDSRAKYLQLISPPSSHAV